MSLKTWGLAEKILAVGVFLYTFCLAYYRIRFGVDFTDEAYYAVLTQRFALGDTPFVDEFNLRQAAAVLLVPSYKLYLQIVGSTDGIILFLRHHYFFLQCLTAWGVFRLLRIGTRFSFALIGAAIPLAFIPLGVPAPGYNNLGALFWALGTCLALTGVLANHRRDLIGAGAVHALACVAYPPLVIAVAGIMFALFRQAAHTRPRKSSRCTSQVLHSSALFLQRLSAPDLLKVFSKRSITNE